MNKEKRDLLFGVSVKKASDGSIKHLKRYQEVEIEWQKGEGIPSKENEVISFSSSGEGESFDYKFALKKLKLKKGWFKDEVIDYKLEPVQDEESIKIIIAWGYKVAPSQIRWGNLVSTVIVSIFLIAGITWFVLWKRKK